MKKLLVLMLVLGLASVANATLTIGVYETDGVTPYDGRALLVSENLVLKIIAVGGDTGDSGGFALIADTTLGTISGGATVIPPAPDLSMYLGSATSNFVGGMGANDDGIVGMVGSAPPAVPPYPDGVYFDEILFRCEDVTDVTVYLYDIGTTWNIADGLIDSAVIHQIPEPMTIALLGLGGLFLLRRRK